MHLVGHLYKTSRPVELNIYATGKYPAKSKLVTSCYLFTSGTFLVILFRCFLLLFIYFHLCYVMSVSPISLCPCIAFFHITVLMHFGRTQIKSAFATLLLRSICFYSPCRSTGQTSTGKSSLTCDYRKHPPEGFTILF